MSKPRTVLVTGCSDGGLGTSLVIAFKNAGWNVIATLRNTSKAKRLEGKGIEILPLDVTKQDSITQCASKVKELTGGKLHMLIHNAGGGYGMPIIDIDLDEMRKLYELNVFSIIPVTKACLPLLIEAEGINVIHASVASFFSTALQGAYNSSKAAAAMLGATLRNELAPFNVQSVVLQSGTVNTNFWENLSAKELPEDSMYKSGGEKVEAFLRGEVIGKDGTPADDWAAVVVKDLSVARPAPYIYRGKHSTAARISMHLPTMVMDMASKQESGLDEVAAAFKKQRESK